MATRQTLQIVSPLALLWQIMHGFRGKYALAIAALFVFTVINYLAPLVASAAIDFAISREPGESILTTRIIRLMGGADRDARSCIRPRRGDPGAQWDIVLCRTDSKRR